ncbi:family 2 glycosyl transferase [Cyclobacterium jeungdonense]|uniref:Family 2 glycosyl transferase n=1 Tax=Cyclobacterium jeungdonense TaxID=708087 RepID=A0ABT8CDR4_9BACT|nr:family 2 glycosyl transferase [Cyclobacterium jeungdonense]MDN3690337.1 family 2 glycosyl transferase [Cyclobacterium jeungdonense]
MQAIIGTYTKRFQVKESYLKGAPPDDLSLVVVIPAYMEPNIDITLNSLGNCQPTTGSVEVICVVNAPAGAPDAVLTTNRECIRQVQEWKRNHPDHFIQLKLIREEALPKKKAGAGLARKIGMDEALRRWGMLGKNGPILCLDADCEVSEPYLVAAEKAFQDPSLDLGHFMFEHRYKNEPKPALASGIIQYELHLRCYIQGLKWAGYPFAFHTVGSCMAVRAAAYARSGGMNSRKAGEDFYFMHKLLPVVKFSYLDATVFPSCRASDRVPFGTGRAQLDFLGGDSLAKESYHPDSYACLKELFTQIPLLYDQEPHKWQLPEPLKEILEIIEFQERVQQIKRESTTKASFLKKFWQWFDGFLVLKLTHYLRDHFFPNLPVTKAAQQILASDSLALQDPDAVTLLAFFRKRDTSYSSMG